MPLFDKKQTGELSVRLFDLTHLKLSNDVIGHNPTDEKISELYSKLVLQIISESTSNKYLASAGNCGLILIEHSDSAISDEKIDNFLQNALATQPILSIATASRKCNPNEIADTIEQLELDCKEKKENSKLNKIKRKETILPLQLSLKDSINLYMKTSPNPYSMENKQQLISQIYSSLAQVIQENFPDQKPTVFQDER